MAFPRMMARAGSFAFVTVPERIDSIFGTNYGGSMTMNTTANKTWDVVSTVISSNPALDSSSPTMSGLAAASGDIPHGFGPLSLLQFRNLGGIFAYLTSKWALSCFTLVSLQLVILPSSTAANNG